MEETLENIVKEGSKIDLLHERSNMNIQMFDFSATNAKYKNRINGVTKVASVCYANPKAINSVKLYDRLANESKGLPSSSYEFIPILFNYENLLGLIATVDGNLNVMESDDIMGIVDKFPIFRYGRIIVEDGTKYLITNLRAVLNCDPKYELYDTYNSSEKEIDIIRRNFFVFKLKVDVVTRVHLLRHRSFFFQELSRRYVSGSKVPFEFYENYEFNSSSVQDKAIELYNELRNDKISAQSARRVIPQTMLTELWVGSFNSKELQSFFDLRTHSSTQFETRIVAQIMQKEIEEILNN